MKRILICFGTRPEYIKIKSLIDNIPSLKTVFIGQHVDLLENINCDYFINIDDCNGNRLNSIMGSILKKDIFDEVDYVLVQGDTTSALSMAISAFHNHKRVIHLEAGLRTHDKYNPYPEEINRQIISRIANIHLCPTETNKINLNRENINDNIFITGNTGLDNINKKGCQYGDKILVTMHRRDNLLIMDEWFKSLSNIASKNRNIKFIIPLHPNPDIQKYKHLLKELEIVKPMSHEKLIETMKGCKFIISDSGGIQEEASYLNKKIIVCRKHTERIESLGKHSILCKKPEDLEDIFKLVMNDYQINMPCPYGDGHAWKKIKKIFDII